MTIISQVKPLFEKQAWSFSHPRENCYRFCKNTKEFNIYINGNSIDVSVPLKDSESLYKTAFDNPRKCIDYLELHLDYHKN